MPEPHATEDKNSPLVERVLIAQDVHDIERYLAFFEIIRRGFLDYCEGNGLNESGNEFGLGHAVFDYLMADRMEHPYGSSDGLAEVLEFYIERKGDYPGSCFPSTVLFNALFDSLWLPHTRILAPQGHVLSRIESGHAHVNIENTMQSGYDVNEMTTRSGRIIDAGQLCPEPNVFLVAHAYFRTAQDFFHGGDYDTAWKYLEMSERVYALPEQAGLRTALNRHSDF